MYISIKNSIKLDHQKIVICVSLKATENWIDCCRN